MKRNNKETENKMTDAALAREFYKNKSHANFNALWVRYYFGLKKYAFGILKDEDKAKDAIVESFSNAWNKRDSFDPNKGAFSTWIYRICRNVCLGYLAMKKKDAYIDYDISDCYDSMLSKASVDVAEELDDKYVMNEDNELELMSRDEIIKKLYDVSVCEIERVENAKVKRVLYDKLVKGKKLREIADAENTNMSNIKNRLYTGKEMIMHLVQEKHPKLYEMYLSVATE